MNNRIVFNPATVKQARGEKGMTQMEIAKETGLSLVTVGYIETGYKEPKVNTLARIATVLNKPMSYFFANNPNNS